MNREIFREYDVRGLVEKDLTPGLVEKLGRAVGTYAAGHAVTTMTLGRDCRLSSGALGEAMKKGLLSTGLDVIDIGTCATPILYFSVRHLKTGGGVMVTGSHNPPEFNGFKICVGPDTIYGSEIQKLREIIERGAFRSGSGRAESLDISKFYLDYIYENVKVRPGLRVVLDGGNGVGGYFARPLFERFGCELTCLNEEMDGRFPNHHPDPTVPENLRELITQVRQKKADVGIAFDGDADRIGVVTDEGEILWGDELLLLFSRFILKEKPGATIIGEVKCSQRLYDDIAAHGGRPIMWKAGHSLIKGKMKEEKAVLAGEMSGHLFFADRYFGYDDAIYAAARLLEILSVTGKKLSEHPRRCSKDDHDTGDPHRLPRRDQVRRGARSDGGLPEGLPHHRYRRCAYPVPRRLGPCSCFKHPACPGAALRILHGGKPCRHPRRCRKGAQPGHLPISIKGLRSSP